MSNKVPDSKSTPGVVDSGFWGIVGVGFGVMLLIRSGYEQGLDLSRKVLRRHDKDVKRMERREKQFIREQKKQEKQKERGRKNTFRWPSFFGVSTSEQDDTTK